MSFIDQQHAKLISNWCEKHPKESEAYFKAHAEISQLFIQKKISYTEFHRRSNNIKTTYKFLE
jgi:hypothetical protein